MAAGCAPCMESRWTEKKKQAHSICIGQVGESEILASLPGSVVMVFHHFSQCAIAIFTGIMSVALCAHMLSGCALRFSPNALRLQPARSLRHASTPS